MRRLIVASILVAAASLVAAATHGHRVRAGETLSELAERYELDDWGCLVAWNPTLASRGLREGMVLDVQPPARVEADASLCRAARAAWRGPIGEGAPEEDVSQHLGATASSLIPKPGEHESRIVQIEYAADRVVRVQTQIGIATVFVLEEGEEVVSWYSGDLAAWDLTTDENIVSIKPVAERPETNLILRTNRRRYFLDLVLAENPYYEVTFVYPDTDRRAGIERQLERSLLEPTGHLDYESTFGAGVNVAYSATGHGNIRPDRVVDNGRFTYVHFPEDRAIPAPYAVEDDGTERLLNFRMRGNWMILLRVGRLFRLRYGQSVICLRNDRFRPAYRDAPTETVDDRIYRVIDGGG